MLALLTAAFACLLGDSFLLSLDIDPEQGTSAGVGIEFEDLPNSVDVDDILLLDDGKLRLREAVAPRQPNAQSQ